MKRKTNPENGKTLKKLWNHIAKFRVLLILSVLMAGATVILQLYVPILFGDAIDNIVAAGKVDFTMVGYYLKRVVILAVLSGVTGWVMSVINNRMTYRVVQDIRAQSIRHIQRLPLSYLDKHSSGDIVSRIIADADILSDGLLMGFSQLFSGIVTIVVTLVFMFSKNFWITLLVICLTPVSFWVAKFISSHSYGMFRKQSEARGKQTALIDEIIGNQKVVRAYGYEERVSKRFAEINGELRDYSAQAVFYSSLTNPCTRFVNSLIYAGVALLGAILIPVGSLTVGGLTVLLSYANQYMKPFNDISSVVTEMQNALACAARLFALLEEPEESEDAAGTLEAPRGNVGIEDVSFSYDPNRKLIEHFNLDVKPGMRIAIVGPTGCGKTTIINLLMRFYDADAGGVFVDGRDVRSYDKDELHRKFGVAFQNDMVFQDTLGENIRFGRDLDEAALRRAAKDAMAAEYIDSLEDGLDHPAAIKGANLSGGQKQRLLVARALAGNPEILVLDDSSSALDYRTDAAMRRAIARSHGDSTVILIAQRVSSVMGMDHILVMDNGRCIGYGSHGELLENCPPYREIYETQMGAME